MRNDEALLRAQVDAALLAIDRALETDRIIGVYLFGSSVAGGLRADSDLDLFVITARPITRDEKQRLVGGLRPISRRSLRPPGWRPLEVTAVNQGAVRPWRYPPRFELQYGEWLSDEELQAQVDGGSTASPDLALLLTMVRSTGKVLVGQPPAEALDPVPREDLVRAITDEVPQLLGDLDGDTRNVLLTLARAWVTVATGEIRSKDGAADWALPQLPSDRRPPLARARDLYLKGGYGEWADEMDTVRLLAHDMAMRVEEVAESTREAGARST